MHWRTPRTKARYPRFLATAILITYMILIGFAFMTVTVWP